VEHFHHQQRLVINCVRFFTLFRRNTMLARKILFSLLMVALVLPFAPNVQAATLCDAAGFVADVTVPDGTSYAPGSTFAKTWRLKNIGTCTWTTSYNIVYVSGEKMGSTTSVALPKSVAPGQTVDVTVNMTAPTTLGAYRGNWMLRNAGGVLFGLGATAKGLFWVEIKVASSNTVVAYDFVANANKAVWGSASGTLTYPGTEGDAKGFAYVIDKPRLENGTEDSVPGILTVPNNATQGYIQGFYPEFEVRSGDRFQSIINCQYNATGCYVAFRLDYQVGTGPIRTFWTFYERYEGLFYRANVDLTPLAGQKVKFILTILAGTSATGDRALWGAPRIVRLEGSAPATPPPATATPVPGATSTATPVSGTCTNRVSFVADVTVPDGTTYAPGATFLKTWRLRNTGTCTWTTAYKIIFAKGDQLGAPDMVNLPGNVAPNQTVDVSVNMTAPATAGLYRGNWLMQSASGTTFGLGLKFDQPFWVEIRVSGTPVAPSATPVTPVSSGTAYDFAANACQATWTSGAGALTCPGTDGNASGFMLALSNPLLENGAANTQPGLLMHPQNITNGYIQAVFPAFTVQSGDRFQSIVQCERNATACLVTFRLDYQIDGESVRTLWVFNEKYEGLFYNANIDLSSLAGKNVKFILRVMANGAATGDRAVWIGPRLVRLGGAPTNTPLPLTSTPTALPTFTPTSIPPTATNTAIPTETATPEPTATP
jgi:hypothetical protein